MGLLFNMKGQTLSPRCSEVNPGNRSLRDKASYDCKGDNKAERGETEQHGCSGLTPSGQKGTEASLKAKLGSLGEKMMEFFPQLLKPQIWM